MRRIAGGAWAAELDGPDLRRLTYADRPVLQRLYIAVRDPVWNTIPGGLHEITVAESGDGFSVRMTVEHDDGGEIRFRWTAFITAKGDTLIAELDGEALTDFAFAKIGFNLHHPLAATIGRRFRADGPDGATEAVFGEEIVAQELVDGRLTAMFPPFERLRIDTDDGAVTFGISGELFELQDHRNWTDANLKSYVTPMSVPLPQSIRRGGSVRQTVRITVEGAERAASPTGRPVLIVGELTGGAVPALGTWCPDVRSTPMTEARAVLLAQWPVRFLRIDVLLGAAKWEEDVRAAAAIARDWGCELELGAQLPWERQADEVIALMRRLGELVARAASGPARIVVVPHTDVYDNLGGTPNERVLRALAPSGGTVAGIPVVPGSGQTFADVNRDWPAAGWPGLGYAVSPAVHADDDRSLLENATAQGSTVVTSRARLGDVAVHVGPVTLRTRTGPFPSMGTATDRPGGDTRMRDRLAAAWTAASISSLSYGGATSVSYFDVWGRGGLIAPDAGGGVASVSPAVRVLADAAALEGMPLRRVSGLDPELVSVLAVESGTGIRLLIANLVDRPVEIDLGPEPDRVLRLGALDYVRVDLPAAG